MVKNLEFIVFLDILLISRLVYVLRDEKINKKILFGVIAIQTIGAGLIYQFSWKLLILLSGCVIMSLLFFWFENKTIRTVTQNSLRMISLVSFFLFSSVMFAPWAEIKFNPAFVELTNFLSEYIVFIQRMKISRIKNFSIVMLGMLLVTGEANLLIRSAFQRFNLIPKADNKTTDTDEYNAGRVIGIIERILIFYLVLNSEFGAIGFILAAKSFTRFKDLEKRSFAEYVLIGTLFSATTAIVIAGFTLRLLGR